MVKAEEEGRFRILEQVMRNRVSRRFSLSGRDRAVRDAHQTG